MKRCLPRTIAAVVMAVFVTACGQSPTSPTSTAVALSPASIAETAMVLETSGRRTNAAGDSTTPTPEVTRLKICNVGNVSGSYAIVASPVSGGSPSVVGSPYAVPAGTCRVVAEDLDNVSGVGANVTATQMSSGLQSVSAQQTTNGGGVSALSFSNGGTVFVNAFHGYTITFTNEQVTTTGNQGCTPGYWKNHLSQWPAPYSPDNSFNTTFSIGTNWWSNGVSLLDALSAGGGGSSALGRHAAAALLNAKAGFYPDTPAQVISRLQNAYNGSADAEATKDYFASRNERSCPLN
jgi:hypothetical protein